MLSGSTSVKAVRRTLMKLSPGKVGHSYVGETELHHFNGPRAFALCINGLLKKTPVVTQNNNCT